MNNLSNKMGAAKEPLRFRKRKTSTDNVSLYLEIYLNGQRSYEYLKLYLVPEKTKVDKEKNRQTMQLAEAVKAKRIVELQNGGFGFNATYKLATNFFDYYRALCERQHGTTDHNGNRENWHSSLKHRDRYRIVMRQSRIQTVDDILQETERLPKRKKDNYKDVKDIPSGNRIPRPLEKSRIFNLKINYIMRKFLLLCMSAVILSACSGSQSKKFMGLKGQIESVKEFKSDVIEKFGEVQPDDLYEVTIYTFNPDGLLAKQGIYDEDGNCIVRTENTYNGDECTRTIAYNRYSDETTVRTLIEVKGNTQIWEFRQGDKITQFEFVKSDKYDCTITKDGTATVKQESWFNDNGDVIETKITNDTEIVYWSKSKFQNGNEVQTEFLTGYEEGIIVTYSYSDYDDMGNWTKKIVYWNGEAESIIKREIQYSK